MSINIFIFLNNQTQRKVPVGFSWKNCPPPPCAPLFFCDKNVFFEFSEKMSNFFFNEIDCKKFSKCISMNSAVKHFELFFNSLKVTIKSFRNFLLLNSLKKNFENFLLLNSLKKISKIFYSQFH